jgi:hypothetical protein
MSPPTQGLAGSHEHLECPEQQVPSKAEEEEPPPAGDCADHHKGTDDKQPNRDDPEEPSGRRRRRLPFAQRYLESQPDPKADEEQRPNDSEDDDDDEDRGERTGGSEDLLHRSFGRYGIGGGPRKTANQRALGTVPLSGSDPFHTGGSIGPWSATPGGERGLVK